MKDCKTINKCLLCNSDTKEILHLGNSPLANEFVKEPVSQDMFPLNLIQCQACNHVQLDCIVDKERLYRNYFYVSGTSPVNVQHFKDYANKIIDMFDLSRFDLVYEVASNDGVFLKNFQEKDIRVIGIDPAKNIAEQANANGIFTIPEFFDKDLAKDLCNKYGKASVVVANNVFAHNEDLSTIVSGVLELLKDDGIFIIENSYLLDVCEKGILDVIYHEHMHQLHLSPLVKFFGLFGLDIFYAERLPNHGGSFRAYMCRKGKRNIDRSVSELLELESGINDKLKQFSSNIQNLKKTLNDKLEQYYLDGKSVVVYGLPAKSTTILHTFDIDTTMIAYGVDDAILKQNIYSPGKHVKIYSPDKIFETKPDVILILAWNFSQSIINNVKKEWYKRFGTVKYPAFIVPLPKFTIERYCEDKTCTCGIGPWEEFECQECGGIDMGFPSFLPYGDVKSKTTDI
jgi:SAM-dependent methyltransferase